VATDREDGLAAEQDAVDDASGGADSDGAAQRLIRVLVEKNEK